MNDTDAFFTQTIVGAPFSVLLGRQLESDRAPSDGIEVNMRHGGTRLSQAWTDWVVLSHACNSVGQPRPRPGRTRRWLERHALWLAVLGLLGLLTTAIFWGRLAWT